MFNSCLYLYKREGEKSGYVKIYGLTIKKIHHQATEQYNTLKFCSSDNGQTSTFIIQLAGQRYKSTNDAYVIFNQQITKYVQVPCMSTWGLETSLGDSV